jgi:hypothetical protein
VGNLPLVRNRLRAILEYGEREQKPIAKQLDAVIGSTARCLQI